MKIALACAVLLGSTGCGLLDSSITTTSFVLPAQMFSLNTAMWSNLPSGGSTPAVPCGDGQAVTDCCNPPAPLPTPDCTTTPLVCAPDSTGANANICTAEIPESLANEINLGSAVPGLSSFPTGNITIASVKYTISDNTLNVDLPPVTVYLAPDMVTDPKDTRAMVFGTIPAIPAGTDPTGEVQKDPSADHTFEMYAGSLSTPFEFIAATTVVIPSGTPIPSGQVTVSVTVTLSAHL
jgi:hypothetical protein